MKTKFKPDSAKSKLKRKRTIIENFKTAGTVILLIIGSILMTFLYLFLALCTLASGGPFMWRRDD